MKSHRHGKMSEVAEKMSEFFRKTSEIILKMSEIFDRNTPVLKVAKEGR